MLAPCSERPLTSDRPGCCCRAVACCRNIDSAKLYVVWWLVLKGTANPAPPRVLCVVLGGCGDASASALLEGENRRPLLGCGRRAILVAVD